MSEPRHWSVFKLRPDGSVATRYDAVEIDAPDGWVAVRANWVHGRVDIGHFAFEPGDVLDEYFALDRPYNAFATWRADGTFVAWYCNVTHPTMIDGDELRWHDLWVDVLVMPDGRTIVLDEDELADSGLATRDPALHAMILAARDELLALAAAGAYPFSEASVMDEAVGNRQ